MMGSLYLANLGPGLRVRFSETVVEGYRTVVLDAARQIRAEIGKI